MVVVPQVLDLFWSAIEREVEKRGKTATFDRLRGIARHLPMGIRRWLFGNVHAQLGGSPSAVRVGRGVPAAGSPAGLGGPRRHRPAGLRRDRDRDRQLHDARGPRPGHGRAAAGRDPDAPRRRRRGPVPRRDRCSRATGTNPEATAAAFTEDGWYRPATSATSTPEGRLILSGRMKDIIVLPNGFNVYPEDIENALRVAGIRDSVVARDEARSDRSRRARRHDARRPRPTRPRSARDSMPP